MPLLGYSGDETLWGSEGSQIVRERRWIFDAMVMKASASPQGSSGAGVAL